MEDARVNAAAPRVLVVGATSSLAQAICSELARKGYGLILVGRDGEELAALAGDLSARHGADCATLEADLLDPYFSPEMLMAQAGEFDHAIIAAGDMGEDDPTDLDNLTHMIDINYTLPAQIATLAALRLAHGKGGPVVLISSVAGDRGRQSNYAYGSAKAALSAFASGLRNRFCRHGVHVLTVKPGFIDTPMTWGLGSPLIASRERVARQIVAAMEARKDVIYVPGFWFWIMLIIRHIPERIFKRLKL